MKYDGMNRLTSWRTESPYPHGLLNSGSSLRLPPPITDITHTITYDEETGNIIGKSDLGSNAVFTYNSTNKPHALRSVSGVATDWGSENLDITYTDRGMVESMEMGDVTYDIQYAPDGSRMKSDLRDGYESFTVRYYGNGLEKALSGIDNTDYLTYLCHGAIVVHHEGDDEIQRSAPPTTPTAVLQGYYDAQGSLIALVDENGNVVRRYAYDPWGKRVNPTDWTQPDTSEELYHINRGYTMHEHLDDFGLINMNGRVFDPAVAQFLSPDNYVQAEGNWLNYNRYVYCLNNPLKYVDPSGEIFSTVFTFACDLVHSVGKSLFFDIPQGDWNALRNTWRDFDPSSPSSRTAKAWKIDMGWFQTDHNLSTGKQVWQVISRFTWELPQSLLGYCAMTGYNVIGQVDQVDYLGGATFCVDENREKYSDKKSNFALGSFIHTQMRGSINGPFDRMVCKNPSFMHEYGHYLQSKREGLSYLVIGAVPSLCSLIAGHINKNHIHTHFSVEKRASTLAAHYFYTYYGVDWYNTIYQTSDPNYHHLIVTDYPTF